MEVVSIYKCSKCNKEFKFKSILDKHINRKTPCDKIVNTNCNDNIEIYRQYNIINSKINKLTKKSSKNKCEFCNSTLANRSNLLKHIDNNCKEKKILIIERDKLKFAYDLLKQNKNIIITTQNKSQIINNTNNTNNITNNINITNNNLTLQINPFGKEDLSHITLEDYKKCLEQRFPGLFEYIKLVHLNKDVPQNHNILLTNQRSKFIKVYKDGKFKTEYKDEIIEDILNKNMGRLEDKAMKLEEEGKINNKIINNHKEFQKTYYKNNKNVIKRNMETVENMLLDDKDIIEDTHQNMLK